MQRRQWKFPRQLTQATNIAPKPRKINSLGKTKRFLGLRDFSTPGA
jgi:hypothetical protein